METKKLESSSNKTRSIKFGAAGPPADGAAAAGGLGGAGASAAVGVAAVYEAGGMVGVLGLAATFLTASMYTLVVRSCDARGHGPRCLESMAARRIVSTRGFVTAHGFDFRRDWALNLSSGMAR